MHVNNVKRYKTKKLRIKKISIKKAENMVKIVTDNCIGKHTHGVQWQQREIYLTK